MDRSAFHDGNVDSNSATDEDNAKPSATGERDTSTLTTDIEMRSSNTEPKDPKDYVNSDDVNLMRRETVAEVGVSADVTDSSVTMKKPGSYAAKKTVAQGMMDIALITSNANQLRNLIEYQMQHTFIFYFVLFLIILSLVLQVTVGVFLIFKGRFANKSKYNVEAARVNNQIMAAVFLITVINVFIAAFSIPQNIPTTPIANRTLSS